MKQKILIVIGILLIVVAGGVFVYMKQNKATVIAPSAQTSNGTMVAKITLGTQGFTPAAILVKSGDIIEVSNSSSEDLQLNSDPHPIHTYNSELNLGKVVKGESKRFVVSKKGNFYYHNHLNSSQIGRIVVR